MDYKEAISRLEQLRTTGVTTGSSWSVPVDYNYNYTGTKIVYGQESQSLPPAPDPPPLDIVGQRKIVLR